MMPIFRKAGLRHAHGGGRSKNSRLSAEGGGVCITSISQYKYIMLFMRAKEVWLKP